jgi:hypothetical protein
LSNFRKRVEKECLTLRLVVAWHLCKRIKNISTRFLLLSPTKRQMIANAEHSMELNGLDNLQQISTLSIKL